MQTPQARGHCSLTVVAGEMDVGQDDPMAEKTKMSIWSHSQLVLCTPWPAPLLAYSQSISVVPRTGWSGHPLVHGHGPESMHEPGSGDGGGGGACNGGTGGADGGSGANGEGGGARGNGGGERGGVG